KNIDSNVCMSFGRAPYYLIFDTDTNESEFIVNTAAQSAGGAGIRAAQIVADQKVDVLLTPRCGQNAADVIQAAGIKLYKTSGVSIRENIDAMIAGTLRPLDEIHAGLHGH
ncbi:MAG TPA: NifB/NifX family molybdenum-iron cluster-binding protein, partial [Clostridia bacterium]|nr:NifB/NifX family molybdenum-iron cluster-binding protein [Clostridia bacterium]